MNLQPVYPNRAQPVYVLCCACEKMAKDIASFADLDGEPFKAFYCEACAEKLRKERK